MIRAIWIDPRDNVATVTEAVSPGEEVFCSCGAHSVAVIAISAIPQYHKIALRKEEAVASAPAIPKGFPIRKYGEVIGFAKEDIPAGAHVHTHNVADSQEEVQQL